MTPTIARHDDRRRAAVRAAEQDGLLRYPGRRWCLIDLSHANGTEPSGAVSSPDTDPQAPGFAFLHEALEAACDGMLVVGLSDTPDRRTDQDKTADPVWFLRAGSFALRLSGHPGRVQARADALAALGMRPCPGGVPRFTALHPADVLHSIHAPTCADGTPIALPRTAWTTITARSRHGFMLVVTRVEETSPTKAPLFLIDHLLA